MNFLDWRTELRAMYARNVPSLGVACLNYEEPFGTFVDYAEAYRDAARILVREFDVKHGIYSDYEVCPILFLYRHACELMAKAVAIEAALIRKNSLPEAFSSNPQMKNHSLSSLRPLVEKAAELADFQPESLHVTLDWPDTFDEMYRYINQEDPKSFTHRYPVDTKGKESVKPHHHVHIFHYTLRAESLLEGLGELHFRLIQQESVN